MEIIDNAIQFVIVTVCFLSSALRAFSEKKREWILLSCFYGSFGIALFYWLLYLILRTYTPKVFYVSDLAWLASYLFLLTLELIMLTPEEKKYKNNKTYFFILIIIPLTGLYISWGDVIYNIIYGILFLCCNYIAVNGLFYIKVTAHNTQKKYFYYMIILICVLENLLWLSSGLIPWTDQWTNPYFWFDTMLSVSFIFLHHALGKVFVK